jgi:MFS transporter, ACS family, aldohexuronate transporter
VTAHPQETASSSAAARAARLRWLVIGVLVLSTALSFVDRQVLAALAPFLKEQFHLTNEGYGLVVSAFSLAYAVCAPAAGLLIDRVGLNLGVSVAVGLWSLAGVATGLVGGLGGLMACRAALGVAESGGIPATAKGFAIYLKPSERAMGTALNQVGITLGMMAAPLLVGGLAVAYGWRMAFVATGIAGFAWIPLWLATARSNPPRVAENRAERIAVPWRDWRLWALAAANILMMTVYSLWMNWTTVFLVSAHGLSAADANRQFAWVPPVFASLGGLAGGWLSMRWARSGSGLYSARLKVCAIAAVLLTSTALVPAVPSARLATALISLSFFTAVAMSSNIYAMPLDLFGAGRAAFAVSILTASYGLMQAVVSPLFGHVIDLYGFAPVCVVCGVLPLAALGLLAAAGRPSAGPMTGEEPEF